MGPGLGEAVAVHMGRDEWMLVDSCLDSEQNPASLAYLRSIGVEPKQVKLVVATHWHDDHVGGLAKVVEACSEADFVYSGAFRGKEFAALVGALSERAQIRRSGVSEFASITQILKQRKEDKRKMAVESRRLWHRAEADLPAAVDSLSPCDEAVLRAHEALASLLPTPETNKRAVVAPQPNHASVVLWVSVGKARVLLVGLR